MQSQSLSLRFADTELAAGRGGQAAVTALADAPADEAEAIRRNLIHAFSPPWLVD